jgi:hypothetical protein
MKKTTPGLSVRSHIGPLRTPNFLPGCRVIKYLLGKKQKLLYTSS